MKWDCYWTTGSSAFQHFTSSNLLAALSVHLCPTCLLVLDVVLCGWTCWSMEAGSTWIWRPRAGGPSVRRDTGLTGACAGCWWVGRCEMGRFQLHPAEGRQEREGRGERELEGAESEALVQEGAARRWYLGMNRLVLAWLVARASSSAPSSSRSPRPWRSWRPSAGCH